MSHSLRHALAARAGVLLTLALVACVAWSQPALRSPLAEPAGLHAVASASSRDDNQHRKPELAPAEAARRARKQHGGRVLNVVLEDGPSGPYYRVKLLDSGRVRVVDIQAR